MIKVFISSTLKTAWNREYNQRLCNRLESKGIACFLPQRDADPVSAERIFESNIEGINGATVVLSVAINESPNLGFEAGYAYGMKKKLVLITTHDHIMPDLFAGMKGRADKIIVVDLNTVDSYLDELIDKLR
jgi:nucleoside 2-deoxyribosyltransferase